MSGRDLTRDELAEILMAMAQTNIRTAHQTGRLFVNQNENVWYDAHRRLATMKADRLLLSPSAGTLLTYDEIRSWLRRTFSQMASLGTVQIPQDIGELIAGPLADLMLGTTYAFHARDTHASEWERVEAVTVLAASYSMTPVEFLTSVSNASDWILRITSSPDQHRAIHQEFLDSAHPDRMSERIEVFSRAVQRNLRASGIAQELAIALDSKVPQGDAYWQWRARQLQNLEIQIARIWPSSIDEA